MKRIHPRLPTGSSRQRGVATLFVALMILVVLTVIVMLSTNVGLFEQKMTTNENRARLVEQAAEYALNLGGEFLKAKRNVIIANTSGGWLSTDGSTGRRWSPCSLIDVSANPTHVCAAERSAARRAELYYYSADGANNAADLKLPYEALTPDGSTGPELNTVGNGAFAVTNTEIHALLCRIDSTLSKPTCRATPAAGNRIAVTLVATVQVAGENSTSLVKETWATYSAANATSSAPIVASGSFNGSGDLTVVTSPNGGGTGLPVSIWTAADAKVESSTGGGTASVTSCYIGDFMRGSSGEHDLAEAKATCPQSGSSPPCHCPSSKDESSYWLSGHPAGGARRENFDILDRDGNAGSGSNGPVPDIQFYPGGGWSDPVNGGGTLIPLDRAGALDDDSLFEWIFGVSYVVADRDATGQTLHNCGGGSQDCADFALRDEMGATILPDCSTLDSTADGLYYVTGNCSITAQVGTADSPAIIVTFGNASFGPNAVLYGLLFIHSDNIATENASSCPSACKFSMNGGTVFGAIIVEGDISMAGNPVIVYDDTSINSDPNKLPAGARFARVPGSWLDSRSGF
jgi:hypothetical protein